MLYVKNRIEIVKLLSDPSSYLNNQNINGHTPLILASINNNRETVKLLLNARVDIDKQDIRGNTALIVAASNNNYEIIELLLNAGANIDKQNEDGDTALTLSSQKNNTKIVKLLLDYHADEFILNNLNQSFYDLLNDENKEYFLNEYPNKVHNAISYWYKKPFTEFVKDFKLKIN